MRTRGAIPGCGGCARAWRRWGTWCRTSACTGSAVPAAGLRGRHPRAWKRDYYRRGQAGARPRPDRPGLHRRPPDEKWCGDITYVKTWDGWAYLATVIDLHSRKLIGWAIADHMRTSLVTAALDMAISARKPPPGSHLSFRPRLPIYIFGVRRVLHRE